MRCSTPRTRFNLRQRVFGLAVRLVCTCVVLFSPAAPLVAVDYATQIQPLLAARCLKCHGRGEQEAGLSLAHREGATQRLESGQRAIVPTEPNKSELLRRVGSHDPEIRMPPQGPALTQLEVQLLRDWIAQGAPYSEHWAWRPLVKPALPELKSPQLAAWCRTPIDRFIAARLELAHLRPAPEADARTLSRRLAFTLTGLPPEPRGEVAYDRLLDELLASPRYGERWARHWIDLVHFAETHGHDQDRVREHAWLYRDYLIAAFNADLPYDRFVAQQVAGDYLWPDDPQATVATGLLAAGPWDESSLRDIRDDTPDREFARYLDRDDILTTVFSTFTSTTVHCARCHDHKFDPISQAEYYGAQAVFAATDKGNRPVDLHPALAARRTELERRSQFIAELEAGREPTGLPATLWSEAAAWEKSLSAQANAWIALTPESLRSQHGALLSAEAEGLLYSGGPRPEKDVYSLDCRVPAVPLTALRLEVLADDRLPHKGPGRQDNGNLHLSQVVVECRQATSGDTRRIPVKSAQADFNQEGWSIDKALDDAPATAWGIYPKVGESHQAVFEFAAPLTVKDTERLVVSLHQLHGGGHLIGKFRLAVTSAAAPLDIHTAPLPAAVAAALATPQPERTAAQRNVIAGWYWRNRTQAELAALPKPALVYCGSNRFEPDGSFRPAPAPRTVRLLPRGQLAANAPEVLPAAPSLVPGLLAQLPAAASDGERRAALAGWLSDRHNGLVWRSIVNRAWQHHFGEALVRTPNDFGHMGTPPVHPELLDWLAVSLQEHGGSLKWLHREIASSATYRQSSTWSVALTNDPRLVDGDNRMFSRQNRRRLDAEAFHDAVLAATGDLDLHMGGPSVRQFVLSPGVHVTPVVDYAAYKVDDAGQRRRSVYRFLFRTVPDPFMDALDCPDASQLTPQRNESVTALQALATLNDNFVAHSSRRLAARLVRESPHANGQVEALYRLLFQRPATADEQSAVSAYAARHGLANACRMLLNTNEFWFVD